QAEKWAMIQDVAEAENDQISTEPKQESESSIDGADRRSSQSPDHADHDVESDDAAAPSGAIDLHMVKKAMDALNHALELARETADELTEQASALREKKETLISMFGNVKTILHKSESAYTEDHYTLMMDHLAFVANQDTADPEHESKEVDEDASQ